MAFLLIGSILSKEALDQINNFSWASLRIGLALITFGISLLILTSVVAMIPIALLGLGLVVLFFGAIVLVGIIAQTLLEPGLEKFSS
jgi:hypothetical protein